MLLLVWWERTQLSVYSVMLGSQQTLFLRSIYSGERETQVIQVFCTGDWRNKTNHVDLKSECTVRLSSGLQGRIKTVFVEEARYNVGIFDIGNRRMVYGRIEGLRPSDLITTTPLYKI